MRLIDIINHVIANGASAMPGLDSFLRDLALKYPDAGPEIEEYLGKAEASTSSEGLAALGKVVFDEIVHFKGLDPRPSPSNLAG